MQNDQPTLDLTPYTPKNPPIEESFEELGVHALTTFGRRIFELFGLIGQIIVWIILLPYRILHFLGKLIITLLGALLTKRGYTLLAHKTARAAIRTEKIIIRESRALYRQAVKEMRDLSRALHNRALRRKVFAIMREHEREIERMQSLHHHLDLLRTKKQSLEGLLDEYLTESLQNADEKTQEEFRREYEAIYRRKEE